jgi:hypothetical protein
LIDAADLIVGAAQQSAAHSFPTSTFNSMKLADIPEPSLLSFVKIAEIDFSCLVPFIMRMPSRGPD